MNTKEIARVLLNGKDSIETSYGKMGEEALTTLIENTYDDNDEEEYETFKKEARLQYRTFHVIKEDREIGKVTMAKIQHDEDPELRCAAFAFCSIKDKYFKGKGQIISLGRLLKGNRRITFHKADSIREILLAEAERREIKWMKGVKIEDIR